MKKKILIAFGILVALCGLVFLIFQMLLNFGRGLLIAPTPVIDREHPLVDKSFVSGEPCEPPCWYGLIPGQSSLEEVNQVLADLEFVLPSSINILESTQDFGVEDIHIYFECPYYQGRPPCGSIRILDGTLNWIMYEVAYDLTIKEAVEIIGKPDNIIIEEGHTVGCTIEFIWWSMGGITAKHEIISNKACDAALEEKGRASSDLLISRLKYFDWGLPFICDENCFHWHGLLDD